MREAWKMRKEGMGLEKISDYMVENGYVRLIKKEGKKTKVVRMTDRRLSVIFRDPFYYGVLVQANQTVDLRQIYDFEPSVNEEDFFEIQKMYRTKLPIVSRRRKTFYPLQKMLICDFCQNMMYIAPSTGRTKRYLYANCQNKECKRPKKSCRMKVIFDFIYNLLSQGLQVTEREYSKYLASARGLTDKKKEDRRRLLHISQGRLKKIKNEITERSLKIVDFDSKSIIYKENEKKIEDLTTEKNKLEADILQLNRDIEKTTQDILSIKQFSNLAKNAEKVVKAGTSIQKDVICRYIFSNLRIGDDKVTKYRLKPPFDILLKDPKGNTSRRAGTRTRDLALPKRAR